MRQPFSSYMLLTTKLDCTTVGNAVADLGSAGGECQMTPQSGDGTAVYSSFSDMGQGPAMQCSFLQCLLLHMLDVKFSK